MKPGFISEAMKATTARYEEEIAQLKQERNEARDIVRRALELASPIQHPEQWIGYRAICLKADDRWEDNDR